MTGNTTIEFAKKSLGLILINSTMDKVLIIKKRYTYQYSDFVFSKYDAKSEQDLRRLFSKMTLQEKIIVKSCNFEHMWFHLMGRDLHNEKYYKFLEKYNVLLSKHSVENIYKMLDETPYVESTLYEFPKGHKNQKNEPNIITAIRETEEETNINHSCFNLIPNLKRSYTIKDNNIKYVVVYYVAKMIIDIEPKISIRKEEQCSEIDTIKWMGLKDLKNIHHNGRIYDFAKYVLNMTRREHKMRLSL